MAARRLILLLCLLGASAPVTAASAAPGRAAIVSDLRVDEEVAGDVVALGGDVHLGPHARVHGHVIAVFGRVVADPGAVVEGRIIAIRSLASLTVHPGGAGAPRGIDVAVRALTAGGWLLVTTALAFLFPTWVRANGDLLPQLGLRVVVLGALAFVTLIAALLAALGLGPAAGVPLATGLWLIFFAGKAIGLAVLGTAIGARALRSLVGRILPPSFEVFIGVALLLCLRFLPWIGDAAWTAVSLVALGSGTFAAALAVSSEPVLGILRFGGPARH
jgi:hypothetical protein